MSLLSGRRKKLQASNVRNSSDDIKKTGTMIRAVVTDVCVKRNGYIVSAIYEDRWLGTQYRYTSDLLTEMPCVHIGGEVIVYVDDVGSSGRYFVDCV